MPAFRLGNSSPGISVMEIRMSGQRLVQTVEKTEIDGKNYCDTLLLLPAITCASYARLRRVMLTSTMETIRISAAMMPSEPQINTL